MKKTLVILSCLMLLSLTTVMAAPGTGACVKAVNDGTIALLDSPNDVEGGSLGDAISDGFFGNEPNLLNTDTNDDLGPNEVPPGSSAGSVVGSASPGPATIGGNFVTWGSVKNANSPFSIKNLCP